MTAHYAVCLKNTDFEVSLEKKKLYRVVGDEVAGANGQIRIIDESGEDYLYPKDFFLTLPLPESIEEAVSKIN